MNWIILIIAGLCETGFAFFGKSKLAVSTEFWLWITSFGLLYVLSAVLLAKATQTIPIGVAHPVWKGIGTEKVLRDCSDCVVNATEFLEEQIG